MPLRVDPFREDERVPHIAATHFFTNREDAIGLFNRVVATPAGEPLKALVFHGVGGIGKTALMQRLCGTVPDALPYGLVDFQSIGDKTRAYRETPSVLPAPRRAPPRTTRPSLSRGDLSRHV